MTQGPSSAAERIESISAAWMAEAMGWEVMWIFADGTVECTDGMLPLLRDRGGATGLL